MTMFGRHGHTYLARERDIVAGAYDKRQKLQRAINALSIVATIAVAVMAVGAASLFGG